MLHRNGADASLLSDGTLGRQLASVGQDPLYNILTDLAVEL